MPQRRRTKSGRLSDVARHVVLPDGIVSTGWPAVRDKCAEFGVEFDPWQDDTGRAMLAKRADGKYAASIGGVVISIPRQVGKTFLVGAVVFALCRLFPGLTVIWTAHRMRTASETFETMQAFAARPKVKPHVQRILTGAGSEAIEFRNSSRILFGARERGFGRGFADVGVLVFDEAQILGENAIDDMVPATNTALNPLLIFTGTPPKPSDPSEFFTRKRAEALAGELEDTVYIEFSADEDAKPDDHKQWAKANPSYPRRTPVAAMMRMRKLLSLESFLREALGIWDDDQGEWVIPAAAWRRAGDETSGIAGPQTFTLAVSEDREWAAFAASGQSTLAPGRVHGEVIDYKLGTGWCVARAKDLVTKWGGEVAVVKGSPAVSLIPELKKVGVKVREVPTADYAAACSQLYDACAADPPGFVHMNDPRLSVALKGAKRRDYGDGLWVWSQKRSSVDISPLVALTVAASVVEVAPDAYSASSDPRAGDEMFRPSGRLTI